MSSKKYMIIALVIGIVIVASFVLFMVVRDEKKQAWEGLETGAPSYTGKELMLELVGSWRQKESVLDNGTTEESDVPVSDYVKTFLYEDGERIYREYLHDRLSCEGSWSVDQEVLSTSCATMETTLRVSIEGLGDSRVLIYYDEGQISQFARIPSDTEIQKSYTISDFPFEIGESYGVAKKMLAKEGWTAIIPKDRTRSPSATFPEITDCGSGIDAVCSVDFKKGDEAFGFYVMSTTKAGEDDSVQWVVGADY